MRRSWPIPTAIAVVGALCGIFIAGRPANVETIVIDAATATSPTITAPGNTVPSSADVPIASPFATEDIPPATDPTSSTAGTPAPSTTRPPTTSIVTTTTPVTTVVTTTSTSAANELLPPGDVRLVVANGDGRFDLAGRNGNRLAAQGYTQIDLEDAERVTATVLYYRRGFDDEAAFVAAALSIPDALLQPLGDRVITSNDSLGDVIVVLGPDALR